MSVLIERITVTVLAPDNQNLIIVRVDTNQPGLYGLGCATFAYQAFAVREAIEKTLAPLLIGREAERTEDLWHLMQYNAYWRNGPVLNNAISGIDMALWDIKAKLAGMPLYNMLGGKVRDRVPIYRHCNASSTEEIVEKAHAAVAEGCEVVRAGYTAYDGPGGNGQYLCTGSSSHCYQPGRHIRSILRLMETLRSELGEEIGLITDTHSRLDPPDALDLAKALEPLHLFFMEDPLPPENIDVLHRFRQTCTTPLAIGEVFSQLSEPLRVINERLADYIRCHPSAIGGLTPARKLATLCEFQGVKTAWHGPLDMSPVGLAVQTHLDYASPAFGIQEYYGYSEKTLELFPGAPVCEKGALYVSDKPGHGVDFDAGKAAKYPPKEGPAHWTEMRLPDGSLHTP